MNYLRSDFSISAINKIESKISLVEIKYAGETIAVLKKNKERINVKIITECVKREELSALKFLLNDFVKILEEAKNILLEDT
jgi:hypothetical protein